jgi:hypothetical protein
MWTASTIYADLLITCEGFCDMIPPTSNMQEMLALRSVAASSSREQNWSICTNWYLHDWIIEILTLWLPSPMVQLSARKITDAWE